MRAMHLSAALLVLLVNPAQAAGPADPCAGGLSTGSIVECLKPGAAGGATRGIRPAPGASSKAAPTVNLLVPFAFDSAELTPAGIAALNALGAALKDPSLAGARFQIGGHTDAAGRPDYNMKLSERRAEAALRYLVEQAGIDPARLSAMGFGMTRPYDPANPFAAANRRVQVTRR